VELANHELRKTGLIVSAKRVETKEEFESELVQHVHDLIISDHGLPHFDGFAALALAKRRCPDVPFIFVTGSLGEKMAIETFERGATDYVLKNDLGKLVPVVHRALQRASELSELKRRERELRENEERFRMLVEGVKDYAIVMLDTGGYVTSWNSGAQRIHGYEAGKILGRHFKVFYSNEDVTQGRPMLALEEATAQGRFEEEGLRLDSGGKTFPAHVIITALHDDQRRLRGFAQVTRDITERKGTEVSLRRGESLKSSILETALDAILSIDHQGLIQEWNPAAQRIFGYARDEAVGQSADELIIPKSLQTVYQQGLTDYLITGVGSLLGRPIELILHRKDGSEFPAELAISRVATEEPLRCTVLIRDISERKKAEDALRQSEERYRMLVEGVKDYTIYLLDPAGCAATWSPGAEHIEGYKAGEILEKPFSIFFTAEDQANNLPAQILEQAAAQGRCAYEGWRLRKNGSRFWSQGSITALRNQGGQLVGFSKIGQDLTEQKKAEEGVHRLAAIVESSSDAIFSKSLDSMIESWNPGAARLFGYSAEEIIGEPVLRLVPTDRVAEEADIITQIKKGQTVPYFETVRRRKDGQLVDVSITISPIKDASGKVVGASQIARDITDRKQVEAQLQVLNQKLEQRVRERTAQLEASNRELEAFSYSVSHDLRAPLRHILGYVDILQSEAATQLDENSRLILQTITESAQQMNRLIEALLAFSHIGRMEMHSEPISLAELVEEARNELRNQSKERHIDWKISPLPRIYGDRLMLRQVFVNLLSNALKYTRTRKQTKIEIGARVDEDEVVCFIRDNGVGFDMKFKSTLFGVFQRLHPAAQFEGTGIGLANVRRVIHRHGGNTWADGIVEGGAAFYFSLPVKPKESRP
jgi:PAS domain S-box-containing protein